MNLDDYNIDDEELLRAAKESETSDRLKEEYFRRYAEASQKTSGNARSSQNFRRYTSPFSGSDNTGFSDNASTSNSSSESGNSADSNSSSENMNNGWQSYNPGNSAAGGTNSENVNDYYRQAYQKANPDGERHGLSVAAMICGLSSVSLSFLTGLMGIPLGLLAVIFGIKCKGTCEKFTPRGKIGIVCGIIGIVLGIIITIITIQYLQAHPEIMEQLKNSFGSYLY